MKRSVHISLFLLLSVFTLPSLKLASAACHVDDEAGLLGFKSGITQDPSGMLSTWKKGTDCCSWSGISCNENRVTSISLQGGEGNKYLTGTISPLLSKVQLLSGFYLQDLKNISGEFPDVLISLPKMTYIYIEGNKLSGHIPTIIGKLSQLYALGLAGNQFTGPIPSSVSNLTGLNQLRLGNNQLTGTIPSGIGNLKGLSQLTLQNNQLSGFIPDIFSSLTELRYLELTHNKFSGQIPASLQSLAPNLIYLQLGHNSLTGTIPNFLGNFRTLDTLDLSWNKFSGVVPKTFANLTKIFNLDLSHNLLVDPFPDLKVKGIESLDLSYNNFHLKQIPNWVTQSPIIYSLKLVKCGIVMDISKWNPVQTYYYDYIDLSENVISGSPIKLLNKTDYLVEFSASGNKLKFDFEKLKIASTLKNLDLSRNLVYGKVPKTVAGLSTLNVSYNQLCGQLPETNFSASSFVGNECLCGSPLPQSSCKCTCGK
jgi:Leucine-rich repeat (LRR) protein